jgi:hypothetical protein
MALDYLGQPTRHVIPVGPILEAFQAGDLAKNDPELAEWLDQGGHGLGKTILIALGSHFRFDAAEVRAMLQAIEVVLVRRPDVRVLWKLMPDDAHLNARADIQAVVKKTQGRLRVTDWLRTGPQALLHTGYIGAFVNHGGGNSFHEAIGSAYLSP